MIKNLLVFTALMVFTAAGLFAQATAVAGAVGTSAYDNLEGSPSVFRVEAPDADGDSNCTDASRTGDHSDFGEHVTHVAETELPGNSTVFLFHSHIADDSDRCRNLDDIDRIRTEIKGGPEGTTDGELEHEYGDETHYRWQFRLDDGFVGTSRFTHLFQLKAAGGADDGFPILTLTATKTDVELRFAADTPAPPASRVTERLREPLLSEFKGQWVEVYLRIVHKNEDDGGELEFRINNVLTGASIANYPTTTHDMWRGANNSTDYINRPKWGIYRGLETGVGQRDETVRFANFCSSENGDICPSLLPQAPAVTAPTNLLPLDGVENVPLTMPLVWNAVAGASSYDVYFGTTATPPLLSNIPDTLLRVTMVYGQTYFYQIVATDGTDMGASPIMTFSTLTEADGNGWDVARGHARPDIENGSDANNSVPFDFNSSVVPTVSEITDVPNEAGNKQFTFSATSDSYRTRYRTASTNTASTVVVRLSKFGNINQVTHIERRANMLSQKLSVRTNKIVFEREVGSVTGMRTDVPYPDDFLDDGELHVIRVVFKEIPGFADPVLETSVYLDESPTALATIINNDPEGGSYLEIGKSGGSEYGANIDFIAVNPEGAFPPGTTGRDLPADLLENAVLPLTWASPLTVQNRSKDRLLEWAVAQQVDVDYFTVERSSDGRIFSPLNRIAGDGTLAALREIAYVDNNELNVGAYYRIRQTDYDGSFSFSNTVYAGPMADLVTPSISPNPVTDRLNVINLPEGTTAYTLLDVTGKQFATGKLRAGGEGINLGTLKPGVYLLRLSGANGKPLPSQRFVKR